MGKAAVALPFATPGGPVAGMTVLRALIACASVALAAPCLGQPTPADPASAQPSLPKPLDGTIPPASPIIGGGSAPSAEGQRQSAARRARHAGRHAPSRARRDELRGHGDFARGGLERPALAGVELVAPIPVPVQPPHFTVPTPVYPLDNIAAFYTTPLPPVVCHRVPRDPAAPDPHLVRETTVLCEADNP